MDSHQIVFSDHTSRWLVAAMLVCERRWHADTAADGCTVLAAARAAPPSITIASLCSDYEKTRPIVCSAFENLRFW